MLGVCGLLWDCEPCPEDVGDLVELEHPASCAALSAEDDGVTGCRCAFQCEAGEGEELYDLDHEDVSGVVPPGQVRAHATRAELRAPSRVRSCRDAACGGRWRRSRFGT